MSRHLKIIVEQHAGGYVGFLRGLGTDAMLGEGDSSEQALADVCSALVFHLETFGAPKAKKSNSLNHQELTADSCQLTN